MHKPKTCFPVQVILQICEGVELMQVDTLTLKKVQQQCFSIYPLLISIPGKEQELTLEDAQDLPTQQYMLLWQVQ